jgi:hypothetical protein
MNSHSSSGGVAGGQMGCASVLTIVFIVLKLTYVIDWSWWWVLSPVIVSAIIIIMILITGLAIYLWDHK